MASMASNTCWQCLSRLRLSPLPGPSTRPGISHAATFSTSASLQATNPPKKGAQMAQKGKKTLNIKGKKKTVGKTYKKPAPGERKAMRKRVVLSNTNAFEVDGLVDLNGDIIADASLQGQMVGFPGELVDNLRAVEAFKPSQGWGFFRRPAALMRKETLEFGNFISSNPKQTKRKLLVGDRGSGKSVLMLQAQAMAFLKGWVVINIPECQELTSATTAYAPIPSTNPTQYSQREYCATLLASIAKANASVLTNLILTLEHKLSQPLQPNMSLLRLAETGANDTEVSWEIFKALWAELTAPGRPQLLLSMDGLSHICRFSEYLAPSMHYIHAHDLALVAHFVDCLAGTKPLPNGGIVLAADSQSNRPANPSLDLVVNAAAKKAQCLPVAGTGEKGKEVLHDPANPWQALDQRSLRALQDVEITALQGLSREEARTVLEYYAKSGMLRATVTEALVAEKWTVSGGGNVGELERGTVRSVDFSTVSPIKPASKLAMQATSATAVGSFETLLTSTPVTPGNVKSHVKLQVRSRWSFPEVAIFTHSLPSDRRVLERIVSAVAAAA
ncbi:hypothetical protein FH972_021430 [Carpinus fangiana]|uniref:Small ribosomal subunit protein mS29 n=1 Tax=Carpinus fangiana TaxID=176857 RepID=A0A5N6KPN8_9ROSI|nr:hypothetical protein FH972_021430 [Carpinus fangiana]